MISFKIKIHQKFLALSCFLILGIVSPVPRVFSQTDFPALDYSAAQNFMSLDIFPYGTEDEKIKAPENDENARSELFDLIRDPLFTDILPRLNYFSVQNLSQTNKRLHCLINGAMNGEEFFQNWVRTQIAGNLDNQGIIELIKNLKSIKTLEFPEKIVENFEKENQIGKIAKLLDHLKRFSPFKSQNDFTLSKGLYLDQYHHIVSLGKGNKLARFLRSLLESYKSEQALLYLLGAGPLPQEVLESLNPLLKLAINWGKHPGYYEVAAQMLAMKVPLNLNDFSYWALFTTGNPSFAREVIKRMKGIDLPENHTGYTPLQIAAGAKDFATVKILIDNGADLNVVDGETHMGPLLLAIKELGFFWSNNDNETIRAEIVEYLLEKGALVDMPYSGKTPLMHAAESNSLKVMKILLKYGADISAINLANGRKVRDYAGAKALELLDSLGPKNQ